MPVALLCSRTDLAGELGHTLLWRSDFERQTASDSLKARSLALAAHIDLVIVDRDLPGAEGLIATLRQEPMTRGAAIVVMARGDFASSELALLEAGANAVLRLPADWEWDARLLRLLDVPARKNVRFPVRFALETLGRGGEAIPAMALNLSLHGMLMESSVEVDIGDDLRLWLRLPETATPVGGKGRVVRRAAATRYGVEFAEFEPGGLARLESFIGGLPAP
jgi:CheY-like chemotaxis protein